MSILHTILHLVRHKPTKWFSDNQHYCNIYEQVKIEKKKKKKRKITCTNLYWLASVFINFCSLLKSFVIFIISYLTSYTKSGFLYWKHLIVYDGRFLKLSKLQNFNSACHSGFCFSLELKKKKKNEQITSYKMNEMEKKSHYRS